MEEERIRTTHYNVIYSKETVLMWRESKEKAIGRKEIHSFSDHEHYLNNVLSKNNEIYIALDHEKVVGMTAFNESEINQLYIHNDYQGMGIGKRLLDLAKNKSKGRLTLYTFEINKKAQRFYEHNGFKIIGRGCENEEKMDDIKYEWTRQ